MVEIEVKVKIKDIKSIQERILYCGARLEKERFYEENTLYDFPSQVLYKNLFDLQRSPSKIQKIQNQRGIRDRSKKRKTIEKNIKILRANPGLQLSKTQVCFQEKTFENLPG